MREVIYIYIAIGIFHGGEMHGRHYHDDDQASTWMAVLMIAVFWPGFVPFWIYRRFRSKKCVQKSPNVKRVGCKNAWLN